VKAHVNGVDLHYVIDGPDGAPWVTFANSLLTDLRIWDAQVAELAGDYRVLRYDHRGHGRSESTAGAYTLELLADDVLALLDGLGIGRTHFVGVSMGATTGAYVAHRDPRRIATLTMADCQPQSTPASRELWQERAVSARRDGLAAIVEDSLQRWFRPDFLRAHPGLESQYRAMMASTSVDGYIGCAHAIGSHDAQQRVVELDLPKLLLAGEYDGAAPRALAELSALAPCARFAAIPDAGHLSNVEGSGHFTDELRAFLDDHRLERD
jgi:3-oxoadipate enol-lactonase